MLSYSLFMLSPVLVELVFILVNKRSLNREPLDRKLYVSILGLFVFFMLGFKSVFVGSGDAFFYLDTWDLMKNVPLDRLYNVLKSIDVEKGYLISVWLLSHVFRWSQFHFILYGILAAVAVSRFMYFNVRDLCLGFVMFSTLGLFAFLVQGLRQGVAICICLFALERAKKKKPISFIILVAIAMTFHATAVVFFAVYFFRHLAKKPLSILIFVVICGVVLYFMNWFLGVGNFLINDHYGNGQGLETGGGYITLLIYIIVIVSYIVIGSKESEDNNILLYMALTGMNIFLLRFFVNGIFQRVAHYFSLALPALLSISLNRFTYKQKVILRYAAIILCLGIAFYKASYSRLIPYTFFWQV